MKSIIKIKRQRLPLQKIDERTNELIDIFKAFLHSVGVRTTRERAWEILQKAHRLPFEYLITLNEDEGINYQGQGKHISAKHGNQLMVIKELGRFEMKAVSSKKDGDRSAVIKYKLPADLAREIKERVEVKDYE